MEFAARYQDGAVAEVRDVTCIIDLASDPVMLAILDAGTREIVDRWPAEQSYLLHTRMMELRIANHERPAGARLAVNGIEHMRAALNVLPSLGKHERRDGWRQVQSIGLATAALFSVIIAYLYGIPMLADRLVTVFPPEWEIKIGDTAARQIEASLTGGQGYAICDANPESVANRAIARFTEAAFAGLNSPFTPEVTVIRSDIPNAFALPGGQAYYLSSLIQASRTPDEFAGVLAHELGHVYYRHGMQTLISTSTTGLLVGFVLGDMTGLSVAGAIGSSLIDNRFSRQAEAQADNFAGKTAQRLDFSPAGLVDLLDRVAGDDEFSRALALFANHPLTDERRRALEAFDVNTPGLKPAFTAAEWEAIRDMCPVPPPPPLPDLVTPEASAG
ncbi:MAG: M48 family metallopeptidase [Hyphomicrobiales bacterium]|nr:MAG: M48 family metallopeptidase [Hyphomicrobiales bacterium]